jgi:hypothetical protein
MLMFQEFYKKKGNSSQVGREYFYEFAIRKMYEAVAGIMQGVVEEADDKVRAVAERERKLEGELRESRQLGYKEKSSIQTRVERLMQTNS